MDYESYLSMPDLLGDINIKTEEPWRSSNPPVGLTLSSQPAKMYLEDDDDQTGTPLSNPPMFDWSTSLPMDLTSESSGDTQALLTLPPAVAPPLPCLPEAVNNFSHLTISGSDNKIIHLQDLAPIAPPQMQSTTNKRKRSRESTGSKPKRKRTAASRVKVKQEEECKPLTAADKRKRHNEVEIRRRKKIAQSFTQLRALTQCSRSNKGAVLSSAIDSISQLREQVAQLTTELQQERHAAKLSVLDGTSVPVVVCKLDGRILECNDSFADLLSRPRAALLKMGHMFQIASPDTLPDFFGAMQHLLNGESKSVDIYQLLKHQNGSATRVRMTAWLSTDKKNPAVKYMHCTVLPSGAHRCFGSQDTAESSTINYSVQSSSPRSMDETA